MIAILTLTALVAVSSASYAPLPLDTPEVAHAKAQHLAIVEQTKLQQGHGVSVIHHSYAPSHTAWRAPVVVANGYGHGVSIAPLGYAPSHTTWTTPVVVANGYVQDAPDVGALKAKHLAIQAAEAARNKGGVAYGPAHSSISPWSHWAPGPVVINGHVQDTPEVAAAKSKHLAALHEAEARAAHSW